VLELFNSARRRPDPVDCRTRLLLDPYLCVGPGSEIHADTLFRISQRCAALGITLCVERHAWAEAARDPDVVRRRVDLFRFEPIVKLDPLAAPSARDAGTLFGESCSEASIANLKLLGALHARTADHLVALDGRIHGMAARAGLASRVLTPADALHWLEALGGGEVPVLLRELDPRTAAGPGPLGDLIRNECEPFDPYLSARLACGRGRVLASFSGDEPLALGVVETAPQGDRLDLVALAACEVARGARVFEPIVAAALAMARRRGIPLAALLPPHEEMALRLLGDLGFEPAGRDAHGREELRRAAETPTPRLSGDQAAWVLPLDADAHDHLLPELSGMAQAQLFAVGRDSRPQTLGSPVRKQVILPATARRPAAGDLLLFFHGRAARKPASASLTAIARVDRVLTCDALEDVLALNASRPGYSLAAILSRLHDGPAIVIDATMLGRLERYVTLAWLKDREVLGSAPRGLKALSPEAWQRVSERLLLA
jgi:hypothetical protein